VKCVHVSVCNRWAIHLSVRAPKHGACLFSAFYAFYAINAINAINAISAFYAFYALQSRAVVVVVGRRMVEQSNVQGPRSKVGSRARFDAGESRDRRLFFDMGGQGYVLRIACCVCGWDRGRARRRFGVSGFEFRVPLYAALPPSRKAMAGQVGTAGRVGNGRWQPSEMANRRWQMAKGIKPDQSESR